MRAKGIDGPNNIIVQNDVAIERNEKKRGGRKSRQNRLDRMPFRSLCCNILQREYGLTHNVCCDIFDKIFGLLKRRILDGDLVQINQLGSFVLQTYQPRLFKKSMLGGGKIAEDKMVTPFPRVKFKTFFFNKDRRAKLLKNKIVKS